MNVSSGPSAADKQKAPQGWLWLAALASLLIVLGLLAINAPLLGARIFVLALGWLLIGGGALQLVGAWLMRPWIGWQAELAFGLLSIALGLLLLWAPVLVGGLVALLVVGGLIVDAMLVALRAVRAQQSGWLWPTLLALLGVALGIAVIFNPTLLVGLLGLIVGISLVVRGVVLLLIAVAARKQSA
jgi:uncharacterized membrane protein HdeD (DUF308 family)